MSKLLRQNVGGTDYTMAGCALSATCATAAATAAKVAELTDGDVLADGMSVAVQFTNGNTAASPLTLTVGGVTANICDSRGQNIGGNIWQAGNVVTFLYTFGKFLLLNCVVDEVTLNNMNSVSSNAVRQAITVALAPQTGNVTLIDTTMSMAGTLTKSGKVCSLQLRIWKEGEITVTNGQVLCTIPEGFRPSLLAWVETQNFDSLGSHQLIAIDNHGSLYCIVKQTYDRLDFYISVAWITA